ncbi:type II secretion system F family protein [Candidatus Atribacteria bacterium 1244-E10-H5-B2]|nr:MAG: type II secretion system F family protein [Candidatus Atribacteria bacterium 1244-E10-H5-B2]
MATFVYKVRDRTGKIFTGSMEGENRGTVVSRLREMDYFITSIREKKRSFLFLKEITLFQSIKFRDLTIFYRQFSTMVNAGLTLVNSLDILAEQVENKALSNVIKVIKSDVEAGSTLADACTKQPRVFSELNISMIRAGEIGGALDEILNKIADLMEKEYALRQKVKSAMAYPSFIAAAAVLMSIFMLTFILPQFVGVFDQFGGELPALTNFFVVLTKLFNKYWYLFFIIFAALVFVFLAYIRTSSGKINFDKFKLSAPIFGEINRKTAVARFTRILGTLIKSGVPILEAMKVSSDAIGNMVISLAVNNAKTKIKEGQSISSPLAASGVFPTMVTQMIMVGEESGELEGMLINVAKFYDQEVDRAVERLTSIIEPLMMAFIALTVGTMIIAMYLPIFNMVNLIQ